MSFELCVNYLPTDTQIQLIHFLSLYLSFALFQCFYSNCNILFLLLLPTEWCLLRKQADITCDTLQCMNGMNIKSSAPKPKKKIEKIFTYSTRNTMAAGKCLLFDSYHAFTTWGYNCVCYSLRNGLAVGSQNVDFPMQTTATTFRCWYCWNPSRKEIMNCWEKRIRSKSPYRTLVRSANPPTKFIRHGNRLIIIKIYPKNIPILLNRWKCVTY